MLCQLKVQPSAADDLHRALNGEEFALVERLRYQKVGGLPLRSAQVADSFHNRDFVMYSAYL